jgi:nicotinate-nucleotide--dimethylbenzimidazole phosphoribosyltransferase
MTELERELRREMSRKTMPAGALGDVQELAIRIGLILGTARPEIQAPAVLVFAADHGIAAEGVSAYPQEVTGQMLRNFAAGGAAINALCSANGIDLEVIDAGVCRRADEPPVPGITYKSIQMGTGNICEGPAMTTEEVNETLRIGAELIRQRQIHSACNLVGFGEMGIGNTSSAALLHAAIARRPVAEFTGPGTGLSGEQLAAKRRTLSAIQERLPKDFSPQSLLAEVGGLEIAMMTGGMLEAAQQGMVLVVDGFISAAAFQLAVAMDAKVRQAAVFAHASAEPGHARMMERYPEIKPILTMGLRLGEGSGAALAIPVIRAAAAILREMATFDTAGVDTSAG